MLKLIHITDTHLVGAGSTLYGLDPRERLLRCVDSVLAAHSDAAMCVVTGDLAHVGDPDAYRQLDEQLARLPMPVHPLIGNHDDRPRFRARFPAVPVDENGFVQYEEAVGPYRGLFLDTHEPGVSHGVFCERRARWLAARLAADDAPVLLFMHHPPFAVGIPAMDRISLRDADPFWRALAPHAARVGHLFFGHVHRPISGSWRAIPFSTIRGTNHQVALRLDETERVPGCHEPPQYAVVLLDREQVTVHAHDYLDDSERYWL